MDSFNPCFDGSCSSTIQPWPCCIRLCHVSILVLMEVVLQRLNALKNGEIDTSFNPCFDGSCSSTCFTASEISSVLSMFQSLF